MIVEHFRNGEAAPVYRRFKERGRMAPDGLTYVSSWVDENLATARGGSTQARRCPECPRGAHSGGGHGLPHGPAARVPGAARARLRSVPARVPANACSTGNRSQAVGPLNRGFVECNSDSQ